MQFMGQSIDTYISSGRSADPPFGRPFIYPGRAAIQRGLGSAWASRPRPPALRWREQLVYWMDNERGREGPSAAAGRLLRPSPLMELQELRTGRTGDHRRHKANAKSFELLLLPSPEKRTASIAAAEAAGSMFFDLLWHFI